MSGGAASPDDRRQAIAAQLGALTEHEVRAFVAYLAGADLLTVELPLAMFLAQLAARCEAGK